MADFICSVYYDNFAKTVVNLGCESIMFSKKEFIREISSKMTFGFLVTVQKFEKVVESNIEGARNLIRNSVQDIVQFKLNAHATIK